MKIEIGERGRRALFILAVSLVVYGAMEVFVFPAYDELMAATDRAVQKEEQLRRYRRAQLRKGRYTQLIEQAKKQTAEAEAILIRSDNPSLAAAELQSLVEATAEKVGLTITQRNVGPPRKLDNSFSELPVTLAFEATPSQIVTFLAELRSVPRIVNVRSLQLTPLQPVQEAPRAGGLSKAVRVSLTLAAVSGMEATKK